MWTAGAPAGRLGAPAAICVRLCAAGEMSRMVQDVSSTGSEFDPYARPANQAGPSPSTPPSNSGYAQSNWPGQTGGWPPAEPPKGLAIASLVCGCSGILLSWFLFGIPSILAVIFGHVALSKARQGTASGRELAIAGLITGYIIIGIFVLMLVLVGVAFMSFYSV